MPVDKYKDFLQGNKSVLTKNGVILISTPNRLVYSRNRETPNNPYHIKEFTGEELETMLKKYFPNVTIMRIKNTNKEFMKVYNTLEKSFRYKILDVLGRSKLARELAGFIPKKTRIKITAEDKIPSFNNS